MKLLIAGSRSIGPDKEYIIHHFLDHMKKFSTAGGITEIIEGGAVGPDTFAKNWAIKNNIPYKEVPAEWNKYGKRAGFLRNADMVKLCDRAAVFYDGESPGTKHTINLLKESGKPYVEITIKVKK